MKYFMRFYEKDMCVAETARHRTEDNAVASAFMMITDKKALEHCIMWLWREKEDGATIRITFYVGKYEGKVLVGLIPYK